ncbi:MAG: tetratricopeptide repeat protein [Verrucomicrobia bacterium]|nr:MAG: tetratricopeptide repeat protein [Verrucomicrobiota bacterium]
MPHCLSAATSNPAGAARWATTCWKCTPRRRRSARGCDARFLNQTLSPESGERVFEYSPATREPQFPRHFPRTIADWKPAAVWLRSRDESVRETQNQSTPAAAANRRGLDLLLAAALLLATVLAYWPVTHADFLNYDDTDYVTANARVQNGLTGKNLAWAFTTRHASNWHPLTWLSHMLDVEWFGQSPRGPHCVNLLLHAANAGLLFVLSRQLTGRRWRSLLVAALFALHPAHVESVAWIAERKDVLSLFFGLLALLAYVNWVKGRTFNLQPATFNVQRSQCWYGWALLSFALGLMSKPMLVTLPFVMLLLDYWPLQRFKLSALNSQLSTFRLLLREKIPFFIFAFASCLLTTWAQAKAIQSLEHLPLLARVANAGVAYLRYLGKTFWPVDLALPYLHPGFWPPEQIALMAVALAAICFLAAATARTRPYFLTGWLWYLGTLVPVIGLVQVGVQAMADRYTYLPLIGVFIAVVWSLGQWIESRPKLQWPASLACVAILGACGVLTHRQAEFWHDSETLFKHSAAVTKDNFIALGNVGGALFERGQLDAAMDFYQQSYRANPRYPEALNSIGAVLASRGDTNALEWFQRTLELQPTHPEALFNLGNAYARKGDFQQASSFFHAALQQRPDNFEARNNLGNNLIKLGKIDEAIAEYRRALDYKPGAPLILKNLGEALAARGRLDEAIANYRAALARTNDAGTHYSLGLTLAVQGKWNEAIDQYSAALALAPTNAEAHYNLGYALLLREKPDDAARHLREAVRLRPEFALAEFNLACALEKLNQRAEAIEHLRAALRIKADYAEARQKLDALTGGRN